MSDLIKRFKEMRKSASNYSEAVDNELLLPDWSISVIDFLNSNSFMRKHWLKIPTGASNCTLTASLWVDPNTPISLAKTIINEKYNYINIPKEAALPGDLVISTNDLGGHHTMYIYDIKDGIPQVRYSDGSTFSRIKERPLNRVGLSNYRYFRKALPELIVVPK